MFRRSRPWPPPRPPIRRRRWRRWRRQRSNRRRPSPRATGVETPQVAARNAPGESVARRPRPSLLPPSIEGIEIRHEHGVPDQLVVVVVTGRHVELHLEGVALVGGNL